MRANPVRINPAARHYRVAARAIFPFLSYALRRDLGGVHYGGDKSGYYHGGKIVKFQPIFGKGTRYSQPHPRRYTPPGASDYSPFRSTSSSSLVDVGDRGEVKDFIVKQSNPPFRESGSAMPYRRLAYRRRPRRRRRHSFWRSRIPSTVCNRAYVKKKLKWVHVCQVGANPNVYSELRIAGDGIYQPLSTSTHQPTGFDEMNALYEYYKVISSSIKVTCTRTNDTGKSGIIFTVRPTLDATTSTSCEQEIENGAQSRECVFRQGAQTIKAWRTTNKVRGYVGTNVYAMSANPTMPWYWVVAQQNHDLTLVGEADMIIRVNYYVQFVRREVLPASTV